MRYDKEDLKNMAVIVEYCKSINKSIDEVFAEFYGDTSKKNKGKKKKNKNKKSKKVIVNNSEIDINKKIEDFVKTAWGPECDKAWNDVENNRRNNPEDRFLKAKGRPVTEAELDYLYKKHGHHFKKYLEEEGN